MALQQKTLGFQVVSKAPNGGRIVISTGNVDRDQDRVFPQGGQTANYMANPVVQWGHNYYDPWATIGRTLSLQTTDAGIEADFELRDPATDTDPQHIVRSLWEQGFIRAASIGFRPIPGRVMPNDFGGLDFIDWELLEWSLVPVPANQDALANAAKSFPAAAATFVAAQKRGRVLSAKNESLIRDAHAGLTTVLEQIGDDDGKALAELAHKVDALAEQLKTLQAPPRPAADAIDDEDAALRPILLELKRISFTRR